MSTFTFMFLGNDRLVWRDKQFHEPWNYDAQDAGAIYVFCSF